jgi:hypothetical protein
MVIVLRYLSPFAVAGIAYAHVACDPTKPLERARSGLPAILRDQDTAPCLTTAPVSVRVAASRSANGLPARGDAGVLEKLLTS